MLYVCLHPMGRNGSCVSHKRHRVSHMQRAAGSSILVAWDGGSVAGGTPGAVVRSEGPWQVLAVAAVLQYPHL